MRRSGQRVSDAPAKPASDQLGYFGAVLAKPGHPPYQQFYPLCQRRLRPARAILAATRAQLRDYAGTMPVVLAPEPAVRRTDLALFAAVMAVFAELVQARHDAGAMLYGHAVYLLTRPPRPPVFWVIAESGPDGVTTSFQGCPLGNNLRQHNGRPDWRKLRAVLAGLIAISPTNSTRH